MLRCLEVDVAEQTYQSWRRWRLKSGLAPLDPEYARLCELRGWQDRFDKEVAERGLSAMLQERTPRG